MNKKLYIFTTSYPFGKIDTPYLSFELSILERYFDEIILVPMSVNFDDLIVTNKYAVDTSLATFPRIKPTISSLANKFILKEAFTVIYKGRIDQLKRLYWALTIAQTVEKWIWGHIDNSINNLLYTYWFSSATIGLALAKQKGLQTPCVTRAHGGDLYLERNSIQYFPLRDYTLSQIDHVFPISQNGLNYLSKQHPKHSGKLSVAHLGIPDPESLTLPSIKPDTISFVSCAYIKPVKRIDLLCNTLASFGRLNPEILITWNHFGGGDPHEVEKLESLIGTFPSNITTKLWGNVAYETIYEFYKTNYVDIFLSLSSSEGIPVSMMEALSFGIPIVATNVGGVPELVNPENGLLLKENISAEEGAEALTGFIHSAGHLTRRNAARETWASKFNAEKNYMEFGSKLTELSHGKKGRNAS